jgi:hypothetical protein
MVPPLNPVSTPCSSHSVARDEMWGIEEARREPRRPESRNFVSRGPKVCRRKSYTDRRNLSDSEIRELLIDF